MAEHARVLGLTPRPRLVLLRDDRGVVIADPLAQRPDDVGVEVDVYPTMDEQHTVPPQVGLGGTYRWVDGVVGFERARVLEVVPVEVVPPVERWLDVLHPGEGFGFPFIYIT